MKRKGYRFSNRLKNAALPAAAFIAAGIFAFWAFPLVSPLLVRAAAVSTALSMPEAAVRQLIDRLAGQPVQQERQPAQPPGHQPAPGPASEAVPAKPGAEAGAADPLKAQPPEEREPDAPPAEEPQPLPAVEIPPEYTGEVATEDMSDREGKRAIKIGGFRLRNDTALPADEIRRAASLPFEIRLEDTSEPQVLIYHTHATESYCPYDGGFYDTRYNWRSTDNNNNMVAVGAEMAKALTENGIGVIQDTSQHDYPSYNGSYANSYRSVKDYLAHYPTIKVVLDLHRDAIERSPGLIVKPAVQYEGESYAQLMLVSNCDDGSGLLPNWRKNLSFAAAFSQQLEELVPGITRPVLFSYRKYNQQLSSGALLLEFGSHANTLEEARRTARVAGEALAELLNSTREGS